MRRTGLVLVLALAGAAPASAQYWDGGAPPPYAGGPYGADWGPGPYHRWVSGETDIAICPPGYHIGRSGRLCWPNR